MSAVETKTAETNGTVAPTKPTNVIEALAAVRRDLPGIGKDNEASAQQGGYRYRGIEAITAAVGPLLGKHGVVFAPQVITWEETPLTINGKPWTDTRMRIEYRVYGPGGLQDYIVVGPLCTIGRDNSDKGPNKCATQAFKQALLQVLCIGDSKDDPDGSTHEADATKPEPQKADKATHDTIRDTIGRLRPKGKEELFAWWAEAGFPGIKRQDNLTEAQANAVLGRLDDLLEAQVIVDAAEAAEDGAVPEGDLGWERL